MPTPASLPLYRLVAALLLAWLIGGAAASPLTACCTGSEPCCEAVPAGQGCVGCASIAAVPAAALPPADRAPSAVPPSFTPTGAASVDHRPSTPPD